MKITTAKTIKLCRQAFHLSLCSVIALLCSDCNRLIAHNQSAHSFEYREIYLKQAMGSHARTFGLNNLDESWGIWGHNLEQVLPEKPMKNIYAKINDNTNYNQFCFMSSTLYNYIESYIEDYYGSSGRRFAIIPNDNSIVCQCSKCRAEGNTKTDASPAVLNMIRRLAERFPRHTFFTSHYLTTQTIPAEPLPKNVGVIISAMDYPLSTTATPYEQEFEQLITNWKKATDKVYIWDYINNFDDYLTPYPIFGVMQRRLQLYSRLDIKGIFINGSGLDYSTFARLKVHILVSLLDNPDVDWRTILSSHCRSAYPVTGEVIERFLLAQEDYIAASGRSLPLYEGTRNALKSYLPEQDFYDFYNELLNLQPLTRGDEKADMDYIVAAIQLPALELKRIHSDTVGTAAMLQQLAILPQEKDIYAYNESGWTIQNYIRDYNNMLQHLNLTRRNLLRDVTLKPLVPLDPDYPNISLLTDGMLGLPSNYHCGNLISSASSLMIEVPKVRGMRRIRVCMVRNKPYHILLPAMVTLSNGGQQIASAEPQSSKQYPGHSFVDFYLPDIVGDKPWVLNFERNTDERTMAIDEIEGLE